MLLALLLAGGPAARADSQPEATLEIPDVPITADTAEPSGPATDAATDAATGPPATGEAAVAAGLRPVPVPQPPKPAPGEAEPVEYLVAPPSLPQTASDETPDSLTVPGAAPSETMPFQSLRLVFGEESVEIDQSAEMDLMEVAGYLNQHEAQRVVLRAHARRSSQGNSHDRRLSLSRALAVRAFLVDKGVPASRIALRPLGSEFKDGPPDRVDILPLRP